MDKVKSDHDINHLIIIKNPLTNQRRGYNQFESDELPLIYL